MLSRALTTLLVVLVPSFLWAFPDMIRHGYVNCTTCHISPSGGGILTPYGREMSKEVLSTWSAENEHKFLHGLVATEKIENWLKFGGDVRYIQTHFEDSRIRRGDAFLMQAQIELALSFNKFSLVSALGEIKDPVKDPKFVLDTPRYYLMYTNGAFHARAGRFQPAFGLNLPDHVLGTKVGLGFFPQFKRDSFEMAWIGEKFNFIGSFSEASPPAARPREKAFALQVNYNIGDRTKLGSSYWKTQEGSPDRKIYSIHALIGLSERWYIMTETALQKQIAQTGIFHFDRVGYELYKGIIPIVQFQYEKSDTKLSETEVYKPGAGVHFFPRPHFELTGLWSRVKARPSWGDEAYLLGHYYF